jgi:hypothetical protein
MNVYYKVYPYEKRNWYIESSALFMWCLFL